MSFELDNNLPQNWGITTIGELTLPYQTAQPKKEPETEFKYVDIGSIDNNTNTITNPKTFLGKDAPSRARRIVAKGDILFSTVRTYLKNIARVSDDLDGILTSTGIAVLRASFAVDSNFLFYFVLSDKFIRNISSAMDGTLYPAVTDSDVASAKIPLPPLNEQKRIVGKIEALQRRSQRVKEAIDAIPQLLDQFRQSVLAAAFRGDLTADWRENNPDVEPASVLLEKIRAERRRKWEEAELEKMKAKGKVPKDDKWKQKYKEPEAVDDSNLPELPDGWCWGIVELICSDIVDCPHSTAKYTEKGKIIVRTSDFRVGRLDLSQTKFVSEETFEQRVKRLRPKKGDVLYSREGGIFGIACLVSDTEICMGQRMMLLRAEKNFYEEKLLMWLMNSPQIFGQAKSKVIGTASPHVNVADIKRFYIPIPPLKEQRDIVFKIQQYWFTIESIEKQLLSQYLCQNKSVKR